MHDESKVLPHLIPTNCSLRSGPNYIHMPRFAEAVELPDHAVLQLITELETSQYHGADPRFISNFLTP